MSAATCSSLGVGVSLLGMPPPLVGQMAGLHPHWWKPAGKGGQGVRRLVQGVMRLLRPTHVAFVAVLLLAACGDSAGSTSEDPVLCEEPEFIEGLEPDFAPCGCGILNSEWHRWCEAQGNTCWSPIDPYGDVPDVYQDLYGSTCVPDCKTSDDCPRFMDRVTECQNGAHCIIPCADGCPAGMYCSMFNGCLHDFRPGD